MKKYIVLLLCIFCLSIPYKSFSSQETEKIKIIKADIFTLEAGEVWTCEFTLTADDLNCDHIMLHRKQRCEKGFFYSDEYINGEAIGGAGVLAGHWLGTGGTVDKRLLKIGTNSVSIKDKSDANVSGRKICEVQLIFTASKSGANWYCGDSHHHTSFSDGKNTVPAEVSTAKKNGLNFICITDHSNQIVKENKTGSILNVDFGWLDYLRNCKEQSKDNQFIVIPSTEISTCWNAEPNTKDYSHLLDIGIKEPLDSQIQNWQLQLNTQAKVIDRINELGQISIAAHPALIIRGEASVTPWALQRLRFDHQTESAYKGINGVEFFNCDNDEQDEEVLNWYLSMMKKHQKVFASTGSDFHGWIKSEVERLKRRFWICADNLSVSALMAGMKSGKTYAADHGTEITDLNYWPSFEPIQISSEKVCLTIHLTTSDQSADKQCIIYRDGKQVMTLPLKGGPSWTIYFGDRGVSEGEHWYNIVIKGCLITSPIVFNVTK